MLSLYEMTRNELDTIRATCSHFNLHFNTTKKYEVVVDSLLSVDGVKASSKKEVWCLVTNVARALALKARGLSIPKEKTIYYNNPQKIGYSRLFKILDTLVDSGYLTFHKGGILTWCKVEENREKVTSIYMFTNKFLDLWADVDIKSSLCKCEYPVEIRCRGTKEQLSTNGVKGVVEKRKQMDIINDRYLRTAIAVNGVDVATQQYKRVFTDNLRVGGRLYNEVGGIQTMNKGLRSMLTIDGMPCVELDFKAIHLCLLYEQLWNSGKEAQERILEELGGEEGIVKFDPYKVNVDFLVDVDAEKVAWFRREFGQHNYDPVRNLIKKALLLAINAKSHKSAVQALAEKVYEEFRKWPNGITPDFEFYGINIPDPRDETEKERFPFSVLLRYLKESHELVGESFFSDCGIHLQAIDSDIIADVISDMVLTEDTACFSEHDSVICPVIYADKVEQMLRESYKRKMGSDMFCKLERK